MIESDTFYEGFISSSWFNIYHKEFFQEYHMHLDPISRYICGIVYFTDSRSITQFHMHNSITVKPEVAKIVIFPDNIEHRVNAHNDEEERITLAFNYRKCNIWKGMNI
jgi:hypothetical protein